MRYEQRVVPAAALEDSAAREETAIAWPNDRAVPPKASGRSGDVIERRGDANECQAKAGDRLPNGRTPATVDAEVVWFEALRGPAGATPGRIAGVAERKDGDPAMKNASPAGREGRRLGNGHARRTKATASRSAERGGASVRPARRAHGRRRRWRDTSQSDASTRPARAPAR
jgi:hypothetical protein